MAWFRPSNPVVRKRADGDWEVLLDGTVRVMLEDALSGVSELLETPDQQMLRRLQPPTYLDDPEREAGYRLLAGEELRTSQQAAIDVLRSVFSDGTATDEQLWAAIRALNSVRLVAGTVLGIENDADGPPEDLDPQDADHGMWVLYELTGWTQYHIVQALSG